MDKCLHFLTVKAGYFRVTCSALSWQCRRQKRCRFNPWVGKIPWRRTWQRTPKFLPGKFHQQRSLASYSLWGCKRVGHDLVTEQQWNQADFRHSLSSSSLTEHPQWQPSLFHLHCPYFCSWNFPKRRFAFKWSWIKGVPTEMFPYKPTILGVFPVSVNDNSNSTSCWAKEQGVINSPFFIPQVGLIRKIL